MATMQDELMTRPLTAEELARWPLMHGTLAHDNELDEIRAKGLMVGKGTNSYDYDKKLGRDRYVFVAPATFRLQYGHGCGSILIDSSILARPDLRCSDRDVSEVFICLTAIAEAGPDNYAGETREVAKLAELIAHVRKETSLTGPEALAIAVFGTEQFKEYLSQNYELTVGELFRRLELAGKSMSMRRYFSRSAF